VDAVSYEPTTSNGPRSALVILSGVRELPGQELQIGIIDFYGLNRISASQAHQALTFKEGDIISLEASGSPAFLAESERRLSNLPGIAHARTNIVCCDAGHAIVFVGIEEKGAAVTRFRVAPRGRARLAADVVQGEMSSQTRSGRRFNAAMGRRIGRRDTHSITTRRRARAIQERFVGYAAPDLAKPASRLAGLIRDEAAGSGGTGSGVRLR